MTLMSVIVAFLFAISLWYLSSNHKVTFVKLKATDLKFLPNRSWHRLIPAGGTFVSATGGTFQSDTPGTFVFAMGGTFDSDMPGTFESDTGGTFNPLLSFWGIALYYDSLFTDLSVCYRNFEERKERRVASSFTPVPLTNSPSTMKNSEGIC